jgi:hypothetical protein
VGERGGLTEGDVGEKPKSQLEPREGEGRGKEREFINIICWKF